ncbi:MAG TPA: hypothetical protein VLE96_06470 [Chlamydiales bacterium]|nr:hypothetical protein [Chlamydiales bacterium]
MKKIVAVNGILLLFLFSIKFSDENLPEQLLVLAQNKYSQFRKIEEETLSPIALQPAPESQEIPKVEELVVNEERQESTPPPTLLSVEVAEPVPEVAPCVPENTQFYYPQETFYPQYAPIAYHPFPLPKRIALSHTEGYGHHIKRYRSNYSFAEVLFAPESRPGHFLPMLDLRGYRFDNTKYALAAGFVGRYIPDCDDCFCQMLGFNIYYDFAPKTNGYHNQLGGGIEILGSRWDIRGNFYVPFGERQRCCHSECVNGWLAYTYNAEFGYLIADCGPFFLYSAIGPYYIISCECKERQRGGMLRIVPQYKDYVALNLKFSYDSLFRAIFQAELVISLPLYKMGCPESAPCGITNRQIYQRVERL